MTSRVTVHPDPAGKLTASGSRRDFLKVAAAGGAAVALPALLSGCELGETVINNNAPSGPALVFDFALGDPTRIKFLYCFKQLQADLYIRMAATLATSDFTAADQALVLEIRNHEVIHRDTLKAILGPANDFTITPKWGSTDFKKRNSSLSLAVQFEDVSVGMYNGILQHFISNANIAFALEMVSVEARHSAALRDNFNPKTGTTDGFSPSSADPAYAPSTVGSAIQQYLNDVLQFANAPTGI